MSTERIALLRQYLTEDPGDTFSAFALGLELLKMNELNEAKSILEQLVTLAPEYLATYFQLGKLYERLQLPEKAIAAYSAGIEVAKQQNNRHTLSELQFALDILSEGEED